MFRRRGTAPRRGELTAFIDEGSEIEGRYTFRGTVMLNGKFKGEISSNDTLIIGERAVLQADVRAGRLVVNGEVTGNLSALERIELKRTARVYGDVEAPVVVVEEGRPCAVGEVGDLLVTTLNNRAMPLIRYRIGDRGMLLEGGCPCGRGLPLMQVAEGRISDSFTAPSGRRVSGVLFPHLFKDHRAIVLGQAVQESPSRIRVDLVLEDGTSLGVGDGHSARLAHRRRLRREHAGRWGAGLAGCLCVLLAGPSREPV